MGPVLAKSIDEVGPGASVFLTKNLWGVGSTAPYLHGGAGAASRTAFEALPNGTRHDGIAFPDNLALFKLPD